MTHHEELHRRWIHSHEEDTETEMVFRPADYRFPPSRGRRGFELRADRTYVDVGIAKGDGPEESDGSWELEENDGLTLHLTDASGRRRVLKVAHADQDRLVVRK